MPVRVRWMSKEFIGIGLMMLGACGLFQIFLVFIAQYFLSVGNYLVIILIPIAVTAALFFASEIVFESYMQVERRSQLRNQYKKQKKGKKSKKQAFLAFPITKPLLIVFVFFAAGYFITYFISIQFIDNVLSFLIAENVGAILCLLVSNGIEKNYGKVQRY